MLPTHFAWCSKMVVTCVMESLFINNFNTHCGCSFWCNVLIQCIFRLQSENLVNLDSFLAARPLSITLHYPHLICKVIIIVFALTFMNPMLANNNQKSVQTVNCIWRWVCITPISAPLVRIPLPSSLSNMFHSVIGCLNNQAATVPLHSHCAILASLLDRCSFHMALWSFIIFDCLDCYASICVVSLVEWQLPTDMKKM